MGLERPVSKNMNKSILSMMSNNSVWYRNVIGSSCRLPAIRSSVRFLESSSGTFTTEFLWLTSSSVGNEETLVILKEKFLEFSLFGLIGVLLVVGDESFSDSHSDGHDLVHSTTTLDSNSDAEILESIGTDDEDWLIDLGSH
jgi:hypothetical protein